MKTRRGKIQLWIGGSVLAALILLLAGIRYVHHHLPAEFIPDLRAAIAARNVVGADQRFEKYLEGRYGSMNNPTNREHAFEGFFNLTHIKTMRLLVRHSPPDQRQANIMASANWIQNYRQTMTPQEKADLQTYFTSGDGSADLRAATAQFLTQDPEYRSAVVPTVTELMSTLASLKQ
jgi:hypothetical protein